MAQFRDRYKKAIIDSGLSYAEISTITGIPKSALHRYASGETKKIPIDAVEKIAKAFGVSASYIAGWENKEPPAADPMEKLREGFEAVFKRPVSREQAEKLFQGMKILIDAQDQR